MTDTELPEGCGCYFEVRNLLPGYIPMLFRELPKIVHRGATYFGVSKAGYDRIRPGQDVFDTMVIMKNTGLFC
jgi:hypothetical protein